jgi:hypothetical protein
MPLDTTHTVSPPKTARGNEPTIALQPLPAGLKKFYAHTQRDMPQILRQVEKERGRGMGV